MKKFNIAAIDIGGTFTKMAILTNDGTFLENKKIKTPHLLPPEKMIKNIAGRIKELGKGLSFNTCIIGIPGLINSKEGKVIKASNLKGWENIELKTILQKETKAQIIIENDANLIALGEMGFGAAKNFKNFILLAIGTGLGGGIILDGKLYRGVSGYAGEFGHFNIKRNGFKCSCGKYGCLETYVSSIGVNNLYNKYSKKFSSFKVAKNEKGNINPADLFNAYKKGNTLAIKIFNEMGRTLGSFISGIANSLDVETFVLTGGVSNSYEAFINPLLNEVKKRTFPEISQNLSILKGTLGDKAALLGGLLLLKQQ